MSQRPSVVFRADGNAQIGLGHVMRCLALAEMLRPDFACRFAIHQPSPGLSMLFQQKQIALIALPTQDMTEFLSVVEADDLVVLDGYSFDEAFQRTIRRGCKGLIVIDDLVRGHQVADVVINHTAGIRQSDYEAEPYTRFLLGPQYALVNPLFTAHAPIPSTQAILINLGGADPMNVSYQIVDHLIAHNSGSSLRVVLGGANPHKASFAQMPVNQVTILSGLSVAGMAHEIEQCRLAIVSCSTVSYEVATVGRPFIGILTADNQTRLARFLADQSLAVGVLSLPLNLTQLSFLVRQATPDRGVTQQRRYLDGQAEQRFRAAFRNLLSR